MNDDNKAAVPLHEVTKPEPTDVERLLATGERLLRGQQERLITEESKYQEARTRIVNDYRMRMERLGLEAEEALLAMDRQHEARMSSIRKLVEKLNAMRGA